MRFLSNQKQAAELRAGRARLFQNDMSWLGRKNFSSLCQLLDKHIQHSVQTEIYVEYLKKIFHASAYICEIIPQNDEKIVDSEAVKAGNTDVKCLEKVLGTYRLTE